MYGASKAVLAELFGESSDDGDSDKEYVNSGGASDRNRVLVEVFGESSDDGGFEEEDIKSESIQCFEQFGDVNGLWVFRDFLSPQQQSTLLSDVLKEGWFSESSNNQAMRFGELPLWAVELSDSIRDFVLWDHPDVFNPPELDRRGGSHPFPSHLLSREPLFDQLIVNKYRPGEGISAHVDLMRFEDGIAIVSLESSCVMHFSRAEETTSDGFAKIPVYLNPGSLVLMSGEARYLWKHEINRNPGFQKWKGRELNQKRRISITLRKLCQDD